AGYTAPTSNDNTVAPGSFSGNMAVQFATANASTGVGLDLNVTIGGHTYNIGTTGGTANPGDSQIKLALSSATFKTTSQTVLDVNGGGPACNGTPTCRANISGFLSGYGGTGAGLSYNISQFGNTNNPGAVMGTAAFTKAP